MCDLFNKIPVNFAIRPDKSLTLKNYLSSLSQNSDEISTELPMIVNVVSLNNYGRSLKNILSKNSKLLLISVGQLESILADCYVSDDTRSNMTQRSWLDMNSNKIAIESMKKFQTMRKLSKSVVSLASNLTTIGTNEEVSLASKIDENSLSLNERVAVRSLNEKRSSTNYLCRVPINYQGYFELLDENGRAMEPCQKLTDLIITEYDENDPEQRIQRWPQGFLLRSSCVAYTKRVDNDESISSSDIEMQRSIVVLNEERITLKSGEVLTILNECFGNGIKTNYETMMSELSTSSMDSSTPPSRTKNKSLFSILKKARQSSSPRKTSGERKKSMDNDVEIYLRCQRENGTIVYILLDENGLFTSIDEKNNRLNCGGVFRLSNLLSNFRFPISVRLVDQAVRFENIYSPSMIHRKEKFSISPKKLRLLMSNDERVIFVCPLNRLRSKHQKSPPSIIVLPISVDADFLINPCLNMSEISETESFQQLIDSCREKIELYRTQISIVHFPPHLTNYKVRPKNRLFEQRSQSESQLEFFHDESRQKKILGSFDKLDENQFCSDESTNTDETKRKLKYLERTFDVMKENHRPIEIDRLGSATDDESQSEDDIYHEVDQLYDYVRSGDKTIEVERIQAQNSTIQRSRSAENPGSTSFKQTVKMTQFKNQ